MSISKISIEDGCTICGLCEQISPEVFKMSDTTVDVDAAAKLNEYEANIREAAESCPVSVIEITE